MNYEEEFFRRMLFKGSNSYAGFNLIIGLISLALLIVYFCGKALCKFIMSRKSKNNERGVHRRAVERFNKVLGVTNYVIHYNVVERHIHRSTGDLTQKVNFMIFNTQTRSIDIINILINEALYSSLEIAKSKNPDVSGAIVLHSNGMEKLQQDLQDVVGLNITFKEV